MLNKSHVFHLFVIIILHCVIDQVTMESMVKNGEGDKCVSDRLRALANAAVPYDNQKVCDIEKKFVDCISSTPKPSSSFNVIQQLLACTRLRLMKMYNFCESGDYTICDFPPELTSLKGDKKFVFPEIEMIDFGRFHLEGCLNLFTYMQRYSIHPCTETAISALCLKPLIRGLSLFKSNNKYFTSLEEEYTCNCAELTQTLCNDPKLCPTDIFNRDWKSFLEDKEDIKLLDLSRYGKCMSTSLDKTSKIDDCVKMDFEAVSKCLQRRYLAYENLKLNNTKQPFTLHCDVETDLFKCLGEKSKSEKEKKCDNKNDFIAWVRIQSYITMKILEVSTMCSERPSFASLGNLYSIKISIDLEQGVQLLGNKLATTCGKKSIETCYYVRGYMHTFLVHPCIEWMMFYRCIRDNLMVCGETTAASFITDFLEGRTPISINKDNQWNHAECALLNKMSNYASENVITLNQVNPFKQQINY